MPSRPGLLGPVIRLLPHHHYSPSAIAKSHHIFPKSASGSHIPQCRGSLNKSLRKRRNYAKFWSKLHIPLQFVNSVMTFLALPLFQSFRDTAWVTQLISPPLLKSFLSSQFSWFQLNWSLSSQQESQVRHVLMVRRHMLKIGMEKYFECFNKLLFYTLTQYSAKYWLIPRLAYLLESSVEISNHFH